MKLSIVIVNYNVKHFLDQCLNSVFAAIKKVEAEVFVVDNNSVDGSMEMVAEKYPEVISIINKENVGFSVANNQAIVKSKGEYVLLLNPDTVVEEDTFSKTVAFMDSNPEAGALGVKMIDGKGNFLPESKRGLPTPSVAFYKIFGLSSLFPRSKKFARYHMGNLSKDETNEVEILAGAFMLMRKSTLDKSGLLDETFFMYGEDVDLSYRIIKAGYKNYYFADTSIIHYKGESTKKGSLNYVYVFYKAMIIFAEKHFGGSYAFFFRFFILTAIYLRAGLSLFKRLVKTITLPLFDAAILITGLFYIKEYWEHNHRFVVGGEYSFDLIKIAFPLYALGWIFGLFLNGGYDKPTKTSQLLKGIFTGSVAIIVGYSLVNEEYRFSRAIILLGSVWAALSIPLFRLLIQKVSGIRLLQNDNLNKRVAVIGKLDEASRVESMIKQASGQKAYVTFINPPDETDANPKYSGSIDQLKEITRIFNINEVVFCSRDVSSKLIFQKMSELNELKIEIKIAPSESQFVIGSNSIDNQGSWYSIQFNDISKRANKRAKRVFDMLCSLLIIVLSPLLIWFVSPKTKFFGNVLSVLMGKKTWIGYDNTVSTSHLPELKAAVLLTTTSISQSASNELAKNHLNQLYAKDYKVWSDLNFLINHFSKIGN